MKKGLLIFILLLFCGSPLMAESRMIKFDQIEFPPLAIQNEKGEFSGIVFDTVFKTLDDAGYKYKTTITPMGRIVRQLKQGETDITVLLRSKKLQEFTDLIEPKVIKIEVRLYYLPGTKPINDVTKLSNQSLIVIRGYTYTNLKAIVEDPKLNIQLAEANDHEMAFKMLKRKRANYLLEYRRPSEVALKTVSIPDVQYSVIKPVEVYILLSKNSPNAAEFKEKFVKSYHKLIQEEKLLQD